MSLQSTYTPEQAARDLTRFYGITPGFVRPVEGGTIGGTFSVDDRYFLKVYDSRQAMTARLTARLKDQLTMQCLLQEKTALRDRICYPIRTQNGDLFYRETVFTGVLYTFISGEAVGFGSPYTPEDIRQLTEIVQALHSVDSRLFTDLCPAETFDLEWCARLRSIVCAGRDLLPERFRAVTAQYAAVTAEKIEEARRLAGKLREAALPFVLCHTDIHPGNVMRDPTGRLYLVDWETAQLSPKEADLYAFAETEGLQHLTEDTDPTAMLYYTIRRDLEDIYEFLRAELDGEYTDDSEDAVYGHVCRIFAHLAKTQ